MARNMRITGILILALAFFLSFRGRESLSAVSFKLKNDTLNLKSGRTVLEYQVSFINKVKKAIRFPKYLATGYENDLLNDYYFVIQKIDGTSRSPEPFERVSYVEGLNPGPFLNIRPSQKHTHVDATNLYQLQHPGVFTIQFVFANDLSFLGKSNLDTLVVLP
ncbi:hypothetical protein [Taibaiella koreensis]|uniref:hypothetical protein n=1 Tax=Taibaiella koreensis TaxID=1268548 RepID=UPI000E59A63C|nr:hypothetical protein [Taibaiella koreensis]